MPDDPDALQSGAIGFGHVGDQSAGSGHVNFKPKKPKVSIRQMIIEAINRALGNFDIQGDSKIDVQGKGLKWRLAFKNEPTLSQNPTTETSTITYPFEITDDGTKTSHARVYSSNLCGQSPDGFNPGDTPAFTLAVTNGDLIYGNVVYDYSSGSPVIISTTISNGSEVPDDDPTTPSFFYQIGSVTVSDSGEVTGYNNAFGPIDGTPERDWYSNPVSYTMTWNANMYSSL